MKVFMAKETVVLKATQTMYIIIITTEKAARLANF